MLAVLLALFALLPRAHAAGTDFAAVTATIERRAEAAVAAYDPASREAAASEFSALYFEVFEASGMEFALAQADNGLMLETELRFGQLIRQAMKGEPRARLEATWGELRPRLARAATLLGAQEADDGFAASVAQAALIVLREGAEAMLVIAAIATYLRRSGQHGHLRTLWGGIALAVIASLATAWAFSALLADSGAAREAIEGACLLAAAALLAWVGLWIYSRREAQRWQGYLKAQVAAAVAADSGWALAGTAFLAVYREGAETVLFLEALGGNAPTGAVATGAALAVVLLALAWLALRGVAMRLPLKPFFTATALLLFALAVSFAGKGVLELQVAGWADATTVAGAPEWPWLGVFPTVETLGAQAVLLFAATIAVFAAGRRAVPAAGAEIGG